MRSNANAIGLDGPKAQTIVAISEHDIATLTAIAQKLSNPVFENQKLKPNYTLLASSIYKMRRARIHFFEEDLFGEPAWDLLLAAYFLERTEDILTTTGLCFASAVPPTTALRSLNRLIASGYLERQPSRTDRRRVHVRLTQLAVHKLESFLRRVSTSFLEPRIPAL